MGANNNNGFIYDAGYGGNGLIGFVMKGYIKLNDFFSKPKNVQNIQFALIALLSIAFIIALVKSGISRRIKRTKHQAQSIWSSAMSLILVISMTGSITLTGCDFIVDSTGLPTAGTYYFHPDHLGSVSYLTDHTGKVITRMAYTPYGEKVKSAITGPDIFHHKYTGQVDDGDEAGLMYYNARYYDPAIGRFISADGFVPGAGNSQSFNRYMYVAGNPVNFNDSTGHWKGEGTLKKNGKDILNDASFKGAYKDGGKRGVALKLFSGGATFIYKRRRIWNNIGR